MTTSEERYIKRLTAEFKALSDTEFIRRLEKLFYSDTVTRYIMIPEAIARLKSLTNENEQLKEQTDTEALLKPWYLTK